MKNYAIVDPITSKIIQIVIIEESIFSFVQGQYPSDLLIEIEEFGDVSDFEYVDGKVSRKPLIPVVPEPPVNG